MSFTTQELWNNLKGNFILVFDDGEIVTNSRETIYSHYAWGFHKQFPGTPLLKSHHVNSYISKDVRLSSSTHISLLQKILWDTYYAQVNTWVMQPQTVKIVDVLSRMVYEASNNMFNELSHHLENSVVSLDIVDFIEILESPDIKEVLEKVTYDQEYIDNSYKAIQDSLNNNPQLKNNQYPKQ